jgi:aspartate aminotransferase
VLLALCSPLNPTGTTFKKEELIKICDLVILENERRKGKQKPLYVLYDQMYWMLMAEGIQHFDPVTLNPAMKDYTLFIDGISKSLCATGVRVGWGVGPAEVIGKMKSIIGHIGAWAPRAEQVATAKFLNNREAFNEYIVVLKQLIQKRFTGLFDGLKALQQKGYPIQVVAPEGAIYISVQFNLLGKKKADGTLVQTGPDITDFLISQAGLALVPFTAFGCEGNIGWYRVSIGTLKEEEIPQLFDKLERALAQLT